MPSYKGHLIGGALAFVATIALLPNQHAPVLKMVEWFAVTLLGSLFPDIDTKSKGQRIFYRALIPIMIYFVVMQRYKMVFFLACVGLWPAIANHRGIFHNPLFIVILSAFMALCITHFSPCYAKTAQWDAFFFCIGALSHVILDVGMKRFFKKLV
jgi:hypothetical protein